MNVCIRLAFPLMLLLVLCGPSAAETDSAAGSDSASRITNRLFVEKSAADTGVGVINRLDWNHPLGFLYFTGYGGGGVAVGDLDGNELPDLFFANGPDANQLFVQRDKWQFVDVTKAANLTQSRSDECGGDGWASGAAMLDIDGDGDLDIYVANYVSANLLFINDGNASFTEAAAAYGLDLVGPFVMPSVADYDRDGDVDIFLVTNRHLEEITTSKDRVFFDAGGMPFVRPEMARFFAMVHHPNKASTKPMWLGMPNRLLRNEGPGKKFTDQSNALGPRRGDTLSATWWDYNHDGWPDLYVCNDLAAEDALYKNNGDGTFTDVLLQSIPHTPWFSMGSASGDINNDGRVDFIAADMAFRTHFKDKAYMGDMSTKFDDIEHFRSTQLMRNALYVNTGTPRFQEAAFLAGLAATDWTWAANLADLDNDGLLDAYFTNGTPANPQAPAPIRGDQVSTGGIREQYRDFPGMKETNLAYRNAGNLQFTDVSRSWGFDHEGMSFAGVHADLDRDGDLDLIVTHLDEAASLYENTNQDSNSIQFKLEGSTSNRHGLGAEVRISTAEGSQVRQVYPIAGFKGSHEALVHFGLGAVEQIKSVQVDWPSGRRQVVSNLPANELHTIRESEAPVNQEAWQVQPPVPLFERSGKFGLIAHHEEPYDDFARQPLLPNQLSQLGPGMAWGDIDQDGDDDFWLGGAAGWPGTIYRNEKGQFSPTLQTALMDDMTCEDMGASFFDADSDGDLDLYIASGGVECKPNDPVLRDRLYLNNGRGLFNRAAAALPDERQSGSVVAPCDFDRDGDLDLFVGSRSIPGEYPVAPQHQLLRNDQGNFINVLPEVAPALGEAGMVTSAVWADLDADGSEELVLSVDWGPLRVFKLDGSTFAEHTEATGLSAYFGWWNSVVTADVDLDGDIDLLAGNFGHNTKYHASTDSPVMIYYGDYGDGKAHILEAEFEDETLFPMRGKSCSSRAMPFLTEKFETYEQFAAASLVDIYTEKCIDQATKFTVNTLASGCFLNDGTGQFQFVPFPPMAQIAPVFGIVAMPIDEDAIPDLFLAQNFMTPQKETGPMDGGVGLVMLGLGNGEFRALRPDQAGIVIEGDAKAAVALDTNADGQPDLCVATNDGPVYGFERRNSGIKPHSVALRFVGPPEDPSGLRAKVEVTGAIERVCTRSHGGYLSQNPAVQFIHVPANCGLRVTWADANEEVIPQEQLAASKGTLVVEHPLARDKPANPSGVPSQDALSVPREWLALNLELSQEFLNHDDASGAAVSLHRLLSVAPTNGAAQIAYANALRRQSRFREAAEKVFRLIELGGGQTPEVLATGARILHDLGRYDEALTQYQNVLAMAPQRDEMKVLAVDTLLAAGKLREAFALLGSADSSLPMVAAKRAQLTERSEHLRELAGQARKLMNSDRAAAIEKYEEVLRIDADSFEALNNIAWHQATSSNPDQRDGWNAVRLAQRAVQLEGKSNVGLLDTLAAAYAESGRFADAMQVCQRIVQSDQATEEQVALAKQRLEAFKQQKPVRE